MMTKAIVAIGALAAVGACGTDSKSVDAAKVIDASKAIDSSKVVDAKLIDATPVKSTVIVNDCTGVTPALTITTSEPMSFSVATATIKAGAFVKFTSSGEHNFENQPGAPGKATFSSGSPGPHTACLQFTVAGTYPFWCQIHQSNMMGTLTVN